MLAPGFLALLHAETDSEDDEDDEWEEDSGGGGSDAETASSEDGSVDEAAFLQQVLFHPHGPTGLHGL